MPQAWNIVRVLLAVLLMVTAALKATSAAELLAQGGLFGSPIAIAMVVGLELFAAGIIATAPRPIAQRFALLMFSCFAVVAAWAWWTDQPCGCFGSKTPKSVPLLVDMIAILLTVLAGRHERNTEHARKSPVVPFVVSLMFSMLLATAGGVFAAIRIERSGSLEAMPSWFGENLIGAEFPLLRDERFAELIPVSGDALIVMLRPDCQHCQELADQWPQIAEKLPASTVVIGISVSPHRWTVMPGIVSATPMGVADEFVIDWADDEPFVASPMLIAVRDQVVRAIGDNETQILSFFSTRLRLDSLFKIHMPFDEAGHVMNMPLNLIAGRTRIEHLENRRNDEACLNAVGAQRIPDPTTAGDFCRRFNQESNFRNRNIVR